MKCLTAEQVIDASSVGSQSPLKLAWEAHHTALAFLDMQVVGRNQAEHMENILAAGPMEQQRTQLHKAVADTGVDKQLELV
jgi:hypothetical protein